MLPTGEQHRLTHRGSFGDSHAVVADLAAGLRELQVGGEHLVQRYPDGGIAPSAAGLVLVPWPNRIAGAVWSHDGVDYELDVTDLASGNASHGLLRNTAYRATDREEHAVTLAAAVHPQHGYPFLLQTSVRYELVDDGLTVTHGIVNAGDGRAPVAIGAHPFLRAGDTRVDDLTLTIDAERRYLTDERNIPTGTQAVAGTPDDLSEGRRVGDLAIDTAFTGLPLVDGRRRHRLAAPDGVVTELWADEEFAWVQAFTKAGFPGPDGAELAVAIEPMTAPADAFNSGEGVRWLEPGEEWLVSWGIRRVS
jgi:aldose 1-epimerase